MEGRYSRIARAYDIQSGIIAGNIADDIFRIIGTADDGRGFAVILNSQLEDESSNLHAQVQKLIGVKHDSLSTSELTALYAVGEILTGHVDPGALTKPHAETLADMESYAGSCVLAGALIQAEEIAVMMDNGDSVQ